MFALYDVGELCVIGDQGMVELGDKLSRGPIPELKLRRDETLLDKLLDDTEFIENLKCRRMGRGGARIV